MNVIVIVADSLRQDHLGCYGNRWIRTPHLDAFAAESVRFNHSYSDNLPTGPTRTSWWTGRYGFAHRHWTPLVPDDLLLPEVLWEHDVRTALVTDVYHMHKPGAGYGRGFDDVTYIRGQEYDSYVRDVPVDLDASPVHWVPAGVDGEAGWRENFEQYLRNQTRVVSEETTYVAQTVDAAIRWIDRRTTTEQSFLWLDCFDPHEPWDPPEPYWSMYRDSGYEGRELIDPVPGRIGKVISEKELVRTRQLYAGEVSLVDTHIGRLLDHLKRIGWYDDALIVFTSDHGEPFGEHGIVRKCRPWLHEELVRVPMLVHMPSGLNGGTQSDAILHGPDLMPTLLDALGVETPDTVQGKSWWPVALGHADAHHRYAYIGARTPERAAEWAIRDDRWSFLLPFIETDDDLVRGRQLYDRAADPYEAHNLIADTDSAEQRHIQRAEAMELELRRFADTIRPR